MTTPSSSSTTTAGSSSPRPVTSAERVPATAEVATTARNSAGSTWIAARVASWLTPELQPRRLVGASSRPGDHSIRVTRAREQVGMLQECRRSRAVFAVPGCAGSGASSSCASATGCCSSRSCCCSRSRASGPPARGRRSSSPRSPRRRSSSRCARGRWRLASRPEPRWSAPAWSSWSRSWPPWASPTPGSLAWPASRSSSSRLRRSSSASCADSASRAARRSRP